MVSLLAIVLTVLPNCTQATQQSNCEELPRPFVSNFENGEAFDCIHRENVTLLYVHHSGWISNWWPFQVDRAIQVARDLRINLFVRTTEVFDLDGMNKILLDAATEIPKIDGVIFSLPNVEDLRTGADALRNAGIPYMTINSGTGK